MSDERLVSEVVVDADARVRVSRESGRVVLSVLSGGGERVRLLMTPEAAELLATQFLYLCDGDDWEGGGDVQAP